MTPDIKILLVCAALLVGLSVGWAVVYRLELRAAEALVREYQRRDAEERARDERVWAGVQRSMDLHAVGIVLVAESDAAAAESLIELVKP